VYPEGCRLKTAKSLLQPTALLLNGFWFYKETVFAQCFITSAARRRRPKRRRLLAAAAGMGRWSGGGDRGGELNGDEGEKTADIWIAAQENRTAGSLRSLITAQLDRSARIND
jgi:hypothetical protein